MSTRPLEQELRLKWDAAQMRKLKAALRSVSGEGKEGFAKADKEASKLEKTLGRMKLAAVGFVSSLGFGAAITAIGRVNGQLEQMRVALRVMIGDAKKGDAVLKDIFDFTETTPFQFDEVAQAGRTLLAMGGSAATLKDELKLVGDVAAGTGQNIVEIASIFGKIRAKQRLTAEEMMQLAERGVPIYEELEKITGKSGEALNKLVETGKIRFPILEQVFRNLTGEGGKFNNMMEMQSKTFLGMVSTLKDMGLAAFRDATGPLFELLKQDIEAVKTRIEEMRKSGELESFTRQAAEGLKAFWSALKTVVGFLVEHRQEIASLARAYAIYRVALVGIGVAQSAYNGILYASRLALIAYRHSTLAARIATNGLKAAMAGTGVGALAVAIGIAAEAIWRFTRNTDDSLDTVDHYRQKLAEATQAMNDLTDAEVKNAEAKAYNAATEEMKNRAKLSAELIGLERDKAREEAYLARISKESRQPVTSSRELTRINEGIREWERMLEESRLRIVDLAAEWDAARSEMERRSALSDSENRDPLDLTTDPKKEKLKLANPVLVALEEAFGTASGDFEAKMNELRIKLARGVISEKEFNAQARKVAEEFRDQFAFMLDAGKMGVLGDTNFAEILGRDLTEEELRALREAYLDAFGDVQGVLKDTEEKTEDVKDKTKALVTTIRSIKSAVNGVRQMANTFGILGDEVNKTLDGLMNTADAITSVYETRALIESGDLKGSAATASLVSGYVGVATSVVGMLGSMFNRNSKDQVDAVKENTRRIEKSIKELAESLRFGEELSGEEVSAIASAQLLAGGSVQFASLTGPTSQFQTTGTNITNLLDLLEDAGVDVSGFRGMLEKYIKQGQQAYAVGNGILFDRYTANIAQLMDQIREITNPLFTSLGAFNPNTAGGILGGAGFVRSYGGGTELEQFDAIVDGLLDLSGISQDMKDYLEELAGISDPLSPAGREAIKAIVERLAREVAGGSFGFGSLSPAEVDEIIATLAGFGAGSGASEEFTRSVQIARSITEIQANELIAIQETALMYLRDIRNSLSGATGSMVGTITAPSGRPVSSGDINLTIEAGRSIEDTMVLIENKLREAERSGYHVSR